MNLLEAALKRASDDMGRLGRSWALIGGFAVSARAEPRFTRDVDLAVAVADDAEAEAVVRALLADGYQLFASLEHDINRAPRHRSAGVTLGSRRRRDR